MITKIRKILSKPKNKVKNFITNFIRIFRSQESVQITYAQEGEDILLWRMISSIMVKDGIYVDVGCNHPLTYSNTAFFYDLGWRGIAIDPNPEFKQLFKRYRKGDSFINAGVSDSTDKLIYHKFPISFYNTFCETQASALVKGGTQPQPELVEVSVDTLDAILSSIWPSGKSIDLLTIDAEGLDLKILKGHNFDKFAVKYLIIEGEFIFINKVMESEIYSYLNLKGFEAVSKLCKSVIFFHRSECDKIGMRY